MDLQKPARHYPFIEIAVHPAVRERFATGAGLAVFAAGVAYVHWANGAAARQLGYDSIYAFMEDAGFPETVLGRQIATTASQITAARAKQNLMLRLGSGFRSVATPCTLERIELPDGEPAMLLALPPELSLKDSMDRAGAMIAGFDDTATHVAILDRDANAVAHSPTFGMLGIEGAALDALITSVEREPSRLVKRQMTTRQGTFPAAIAHISDDPSLFLLFVVEPEEIEPRIEEKPAAPEAVDAPAPSTAEPAAPAAAAEHVPVAASFSFDPSRRPVRFVWKIDASGRFSEVSAELAEAVGPNAADLVGRTFDEVATVFNLDPERVIANLLERRDTWSGKTVRWPVQGTTLTVPVDLAALPTYTRDRTFDGFRGFGIARISEAAGDPERIGTALAGPAEAETLQEPEPNDQDTERAEQKLAEPAEPATPANENIEAEDDPYRGEVPALTIVETPARRRSDKVIDLDQHRSRGREGLSKIDQAIFHQIGAELGRRLASRDEKRERIPAAAPTPEAEPVAAALLERAASLRPVPTAEHVAAVSLEPAPGLPASIPQAEPVMAVAMDRPVAEEPVASEEATAGEPTAVVDPVANEPFTSTWSLPQGSGRAVLTRALVDGLPLPLMVQRGDSLLHANAEALRLTGYPSQDELAEAGGLGALFAETPDAAEGTADTLAFTRADSTPVSVKARLQSIGWEDGHALLLSLQPVASENAAARLRSALTEIDELHSILETATDGVVILDEKGAIRSINRSASALFDYDAVETRGKPFAMLFAHESQRAILDYVSGLAENGVASVLNDGREVIGREASGGFIPLFMTIGRLRGSNGYCAVIRDITHWKRTEDELRSAKRAAETASAHKSDFLARVSHEIRTPLNAIIGFAEMMATERFGPMGSPRYLEYAHDIGRSGRHVLDIVNDLLDISKIEAGEQEMDFVAVALNETLAESVSLLQPQANGQRVIIRTSLSTALPDVVADQRSVRQIAINLLSNAIRFTPAGGQIVVSTAYDQSGRVVIRVRDTGIGMSRSELDQAMKPFRQGPTSAARQRGDGTGLGLPLTKAMVEANRAQFSIESTPGEGTLVQIVFPPQHVLAG